jgi:opacity protein-like surface antigen
MTKKLVTVGLAVVFCVCAVVRGWASSWEGLYGGFHAGGVIGNAEMKTSTVFDGSGSGYFATDSVTAVNTTGDQINGQGNGNYGIEGGYNFQSGYIIIGAQVDLGMTSLNVSTLGQALYPSYASNGFKINQQTTTSFTATVRPRVGLDLGDTLVFATSGLAFSNLHYTAQFTDNLNGAYDLGANETLAIGVILGAGSEFKINDNVSLAGEYLYTNYGNLTTTNKGLTTGYGSGTNYPGNVFTNTVNLVTHQFNTAIHFHL